MFGAEFMLGARSRLLPPSVPFRFFGSAVVLQIASWALLVIYGDALPGFVGGPGPVLAALHLITLGVAAMTAMGAAFQLLPVATKKPVRSVAACKLAFWLAVPGLATLIFGMATNRQWALDGGGGLMIAGFALYGGLVIDNLRQVKDMRAITDHTWVAMASLALLAVLGGLLAADFGRDWLPDHGAVAITHGTVAAYGFMGMLALGFSLILIPMFALSPPADTKMARRSAWVGAVALALVVPGMVHGVRPLVFAGGAAGLTAVGLHLAIMHKLMKSRMKKRLGDSFVLIRLAWVMLPASMLLGLVMAGVPGTSRLPALFGFILVFGWLLSFLTGILQRIIPFLASMHSVREGVKPVLVSSLTANMPLRIHLVCHCLALAVVSIGILMGLGPVVRVGAAIGFSGAVAFAIFAALVWQRLARHLGTPA